MKTTLKTLSALIVTLMFAAPTFADASKVVGDQRFKAEGNDIYGQLCLAALENKYVLEAKAKELGVSRATMKDITCNGLSLVRFAKEYRGDIQEWFAARQ